MGQPDDDIVKVIGEEMGRLVAGTPLGPLDDFFDHGGDSLRAVKLISELAARFSNDAETDAFQAELLLAVFEDATPAALAGLVRTGLKEAP